jgi:response regulator RpfG family c-di-GMP phosphodiesterase
VQALEKGTPQVNPVGVEDLILKLSTARGMEEIMAIVRQDLRGLIGADGVTFVLHEGSKCFYAEEDAISPLWQGQRFPMETCISGWAMLNRSMAVIEDIYTDERIPHAAYRPTFVKSLVMTPVRQDDPVAAIGAYWARRHVPSDKELRLLQTIANGAAVAMTNVQLFNSLVAAQEEAVKAKDAIILAMGSLAETRDNETGNHVRRTQQFIRMLAEECLARGLFAPELNAGFVNLVVKSAPLHDIGKVGVPDKILLKPGKLNAKEFEVMKRHTEIGRAAIANAERYLGTCTAFFQVAQDIALTHHEKWDGSGYPRGIKGEEIPLAGRMMAVVDVYDALISERVYKAAMSHSQAVEIIASESGRHFDPNLVEVFLDIADRFEDVSRFLPDEE